MYKPDKKGAWKSVEIPEGQEIIGLQCNTEQLSIHTLGFITWTPNDQAAPA